MTEIGIFLAKSIILVLAFAILIALIALIASRVKHKEELHIEPLHKKFTDWGYFLKMMSLTNKQELKEEKKKFKALASAEKDKTNTSKVFVINFEGDLRASQVNQVREEITAILQVASSKDEVVVRLESPGGVVHGYGLGASQLLRLRSQNIPVTVCVDKVAASGGYMMACVASRIVAAPFAILGSIGVLAQVPNFHRLLQRFDVDYKEYTAGEFKRTVSLLGEVTAKGEQKLQEQIEHTHVLFKDFVQTHRPTLKIAEVATGEYWYGQKALELGLVDSIQTSDDYLLEKFRAGLPIYEVKFEAKEKLIDKVSHMMSKSLLRTADYVVERLERRPFV